MKQFKSFLTEADSQKVKLYNIENSFFNGLQSAKSSVFFLKSLAQMLSGHSVSSNIDINVIWDGGLPIVAGINPENNKFFVSDKVGSYYYTDSELAGLSDKYKVALHFLPEIGITDILSGYIMFTESDIKDQEINGNKYVTFQPDEICYAIPSDVPLAKQISQAKIGVIWNTSLKGSTTDTLVPYEGVDIGRLKPTKDVWVRDASFVDATGVASLDINTKVRLDSYIHSASTNLSMFNSSFVNKISTIEIYKNQLKNLILHGGSTAEFFSHLEAHLNATILQAKQETSKQKRLLEKKEILDFWRYNRSQLVNLLEFRSNILQAKEIILNQLNKVRDIGTFVKTDDGFKVVNNIGFVGVDHLNDKTIVLSNKLTFEPDNFIPTKDWNVT